MHQLREAPFCKVAVSGYRSSHARPSAVSCRRAGFSNADRSCAGCGLFRGFMPEACFFAFPLPALSHPLIL